MLTADLKDKAVLVTGGASGIGLATVERFARCGRDRRDEHLADDPRGAKEIARLAGEGLRVVGVPGDVAQPAAAAKIIAGTLDATGKRLDYLVNCAGTPAAPSRMTTATSTP